MRWRAYLDLLDPAWPAGLRHALAGRWSRHCLRTWMSTVLAAIASWIDALGGRVSGVEEEKRAGAVLGCRRGPG